MFGRQGMAFSRAHRRKELLYARRSRWPRASCLRRGHCALSARALQHNVCDAAVDDPPICRLFHRRRIERLLSPQPRRRAAGTFGCLRSRHSPRIRLRSRTRNRRCGQGGRGHRLDPRHEDPVRPDSSRPDVRIHDDEWRGAAHHGVLYRRRRRAGRDHGSS